MTVTAFPQRHRSRQRSVEGELLFLETSDGRPYAAYQNHTAVSETNATFAPRRVSIADAWGSAHTLSLDVQGVKPLRHETLVSNFNDEAEIEDIGHYEAAELVSRETGANRVIVFDHTVRRRAEGAPRQPSIRAHNDYTENSAPVRVRQLLGAEADALLSRRYAYINVWRPIHVPAADWPLTLCDARSVAKDDLVAADILYPGRQGEIYYVKYAPTQRWVFFPNMQLDDVLLLKCYDSRRDVACFAPHTAFADPNTPPDAPPRESIEYRTIAFY